MLYVDIPSLADLKSLAAHRDDICVSIYLPTTPVSREAAGDRIELKNLAKEALRQLETANADKRRVAALMEHLDDLVDDDEFWRAAVDSSTAAREPMSFSACANLRSIASLPSPSWSGTMANVFGRVRSAS